MNEVSIEEIRAARARAAGLVKTTPLDRSATFSALCGREIYLKLENLQQTGSFKVRGALNKIQLLDPAVRARGVVTASAGNHAQGVAYAARIVIRSGVFEAVEVIDAQIAEAVVLLLERAKTVVEGAGAVGLAACLAGRLPKQASKVAVIISGGNIDMHLLDRIINLGLVQAGRLFRFTTRLADRPGELQRLVTCVAACRANIHQIQHERSQPGLPLTQASVLLDLETRGHEHIVQVQQALAAAGFAVEPYDNAGRASA